VTLVTLLFGLEYMKVAN